MISTYRDLCCNSETQNILPGSPCLHLMVRDCCSFCCELLFLLHRSDCTGKTESIQPTLRQLSTEILISFHVIVRHKTHLHSPLSPPQISYRNLPRLCVSLSSPWLTFLWYQQKHWATSRLKFIFLDRNIFSWQPFMITVVIENRITSEVKTGDANNKVVSKRIWIHEYSLWFSFYDDCKVVHCRGRLRRLRKRSKNKRKHWMESNSDCHGTANPSYHHPPTT